MRRRRAWPAAKIPSAKGFIAVGGLARGVFALGGLAVGVFAFGGGAAWDTYVISATERSPEAVAFLAQWDALRALLPIGVKRR